MVNGLVSGQRVLNPIPFPDLIFNVIENEAV